MCIRYLLSHRGHAPATARAASNSPTGATVCPSKALMHKDHCLVIELVMLNTLPLLIALALEKCHRISGIPHPLAWGFSQTQIFLEEHNCIYTQVKTLNSFCAWSGISHCSQTSQPHAGSHSLSIMTHQGA